MGRLPDIFTIGYEGLVQPQLIELLRAAGIVRLLDVRAVPPSRKAGFSKSVLDASLAAAGIAYSHDRRLGTPKPGRDAARRGLTHVMAAVFDDHMATQPARDGLDDAVAAARASRLCLLCFERAPHDCHRSIVAALMRERSGQDIRHL